MAGGHPDHTPALGKPNGIATLDADGELVLTQFPCRAVVTDRSSGAVVVARSSGDVVIERTA